MKKQIIKFILMATVFTSIRCADNQLDIVPNDGEFPLQLIVDTDEGGDLADAEDYGLEIAFADYLGELPTETIILTYELEGEDSFNDAVEIDKVVYEIELEDCTFERELDFDSNAKTITISKDADLETLPESFEVIFTLPAASDTQGGFTFKILNIESSNTNITVGEPSEFVYEVLDNELAGEWVWELEGEEDFEKFKSVFGTISADIEDLSYADILEDDGVRSIRIQFEYGEMKFEIELDETEEICEDGENENENKQLELEAEYEAEDGEVELTGSHFILGDDGEIADELDFIVEADYSLDEVNGIITLTIKKIIDEDNYEEGEELVATEVVFTFVKD